jgi:hypothetical protein
LPHAGNIGGKRQSLAIPFAASGTSQTLGVAYDFVKQNWDELIAKLLNDFVDFLPYIAAVPGATLDLRLTLQPHQLSLVSASQGWQVRFTLAGRMGLSYGTAQP